MTRKILEVQRYKDSISIPVRVYSSHAKERWWTIDTWIIIEDNCTDHNGWSYIVRVTKGQTGL